jgi:hypothetical protein
MKIFIALTLTHKLNLKKFQTFVKKNIWTEKYLDLEGLKEILV